VTTRVYDRQIFLVNHSEVLEKKKDAYFGGYLLFCFILISWGCLTSPTFFFVFLFFFFFVVAMSQFDWPIAKNKKLKLWWLPKIEDSMERWSESPFGPPIKGRTLGKIYGIKVRCYWEHPWGTHWEPRETYWEPGGNPLETWKEHVGNKGKMKKKPSFPPTQNLKEKIKSRHFECMLSLPIGCMKFLFSKLFLTIFGLG
jgi:hypothetical protein